MESIQNNLLGITSTLEVKESLYPSPDDKGEIAVLLINKFFY